MRSMTVATIILAFAALSAGQVFQVGGGVQNRGGGAPATPAMTLTTPAWPDGGQIPVKYTQAVPNPVSPELSGPTLLRAR